MLGHVIWRLLIKVIGLSYLISCEVLVGGIVGMWLGQLLGYGYACQY
jgi:hypothetical protein